MNEQTQGELVPVQQVNRFQSAAHLPATVEQLHQLPAIYTTLDLSKPENKAMLYDMVVEGGENAKEYINTSFVIRDIAVHPVSIVSKDSGEIAACPRIIIVTTEGKVIQFVSAGVWASLLMMKDTGWMPFGTVPMEFTLKAVPLADGKQMYKLVRTRKELTGKKK